MKQDKTYKGKPDLQVWKKLLPYLGPHRKLLVSLTGLMITVGVIDGLFPLITRWGLDSLAAGDENSLTSVLGFYGALALVQGFNVWALVRLAGLVEIRLSAQLREAGFTQMQKLSFSYFDRTPAGWILTRLTSDATRVGETLAWGLVDLVWGFSITLFMAGMMLTLSPLLALAVLGVLPLAAWISWIFQTRLLEAHRESKRVNSQVTALLGEGIQGVPTAKTLGWTGDEEFARESGSLRRASLRAAVINGFYLPALLLLLTLGSAAALVTGGNLVLSGGLTLGTLVAFFGFSAQFVEPLRETARVLSELQKAQSSAERLLDLIHTVPEIQDLPEAQGLSGPWKGVITFRSVGFQYKDGARVFANLDLEIQPGGLTALVGPSGGGKSTLVNLLCRFYDPTEGAILLDGRDLREMPQRNLHRRLGYVQQTPFLFSGSVRDNIRFGNPEAGDRDVEEAVRTLGFEDLILRLPGGWDCPVGEGGSGLSAGERQLVSFARALVADPKILLLDEATASVDTHTEQRLQKALEKLVRGRTSIVIAHRLSTVRMADRILVLDHGRISEEGSHGQLMDRRGLYAQLYEKQFSEEA